MTEPTITFGALCAYGKLHNWFFVEWQIIPDSRGFETCSYSLHMAWNVIPIVGLLILIGLGKLLLKKRNKQKEIMIVKLPKSQNSNSRN